MMNRLFRKTGNLKVGTWLFIGLMLLLAVFCSWLGTWQMERLREKDALIGAVKERLHASPLPVPSMTDWSGMNVNVFNFQPITLTGHFRYSQTVTVFTSLTRAKGQFSGPGYWVMTPFVLDDGGTVFVNRGFVPTALQEVAVTDFDVDNHQVTISGLLRPDEVIGFMTPDPNPSDRIEWTRNIGRLAALVDPALAPFAPFYVDLPAGTPGDLPQGGETVVEFPNNHLGYAYTWYGFSIVTLAMLSVWLYRQRVASRA